ncbi:glycosyltransferase [Nafulsella turpanensis]|uniref:glycosyltransferase n=1 Tax=Nafulsella turpanensis TaxID=1265690 RepID=UPI000348755D|nr:glycosyltransferase family 2 protein [Nafulsella turpanensis]
MNRGKEKNRQLVSVVIVSYNCRDVIKQCIASCVNIPDTETIVIDNASKDGTTDEIKAFEGKITFFEEKVNHGFTKGCNIGIKAAKGKFIMLLNPDASLLPDTLGKLLSHILNDESLGAVAPTLVYPDGSFQNYTRTFPTVSGLAVEHFVPVRFQKYFKSFRKYLCLDVDFSQDQYVEQPAGAAILFRNDRRTLNEAYCIYGSDVELCKQIINSGFRIKQVTDAKVIHYQSKGGTHLANPKLKVYLDLDNYSGMSSYFRKYSSSRKYLLYRTVFAAGLLVSVLPGVLKGREAAYYRIKRVGLFFKGESFFNYLKK